MVALGPDAICTNTPAVLRRIVDDGVSGTERSDMAFSAPLEQVAGVAQSRRQQER